MTDRVRIIKHEAVPGCGSWVWAFILQDLQSKPLVVIFRSPRTSKQELPSPFGSRAGDARPVAGSRFAYVSKSSWSMIDAKIS